MLRRKNRKYVLLAAFFLLPPVLAWTITKNPSKGWQKSYEAHIRKVIQNHTDLTELTGKQMRYFNKSWDDLNVSQRLDVLTNIVFCMSASESNHNRLAVFREYGIPGKDAVTGHPIVSEGLLQISYQDEKYYKGQCDFDWPKDKATFTRDLRSKGQSFNGTGTRSILDGYRNLACGLQIMDTLAKKHKSSSTLYAWGRYWAVMRSERPGFKRFKQCMQTKGEMR